MSFTNFEPDQPTGGDYKIPRCLLMFGNPFESSYQWKDTPCSAQFFTMCELGENSTSCWEEQNLMKISFSIQQACLQLILMMTLCLYMYWNNLQIVEIAEDTENQCDSNPCQNRGTCKDGIKKFTCDCITGYEGLMCETSKCSFKWKICLNKSEIFKSKYNSMLT